MNKRRWSPLVLGGAVGWLFAALVITPPLETYDAWVTLVLIVIAWILSIYER